jgi:hypothetical protein
MVGTPMKTSSLIFATLLPFFIAACDSNPSTEERIESGAEKIAEGLKEVGEATREAARETGEKVSDAAEEARREIHERTAPE